MSFDLAELDTISACDKGFELELIHPKLKTPMGWFVNILGSDSTEFRNFTRARGNENIRKTDFAKKRGKDPETRTIEKIEAENIELLVLCTKGWRGIISNGEELPFNVQNAIMLYKKYPWIYTQINEAIGDVELFLKA